jgi:hypothetical protein
MNKSLGRVTALIMLWIFGILLFTFFIQARVSMWGGNPVVRQRQGVVEPFQVPPPMEDVVENNMNGMSPADASLSTPRQSYSLLGGWLKPNDSAEYNNPVLKLARNDYKAVDNVTMGVGTLPTDPLIKTAAGCYEVDFQTAMEKTGNFRQLTNNYKRGDPDSCSAPIQELATTFYKVEPVAKVSTPAEARTTPSPAYVSCPKGDSLL